MTSEPQSVTAPAAGAGEVQLRVDGAIAQITLARPSSRNALTDQVIRDLLAILDEVGSSTTVRAVILEGEGSTFCAGGDTKVPTRLTSPSQAERLEMAELYGRAFARLDNLPQATIARVRGPAIGGGALLAITCDLRVCDFSAVFRFPEVPMGQYLMAAGTSRLVRELGVPRTRDLLLTGRSLDATAALDWGVVTRVVEGDALDAHVDEMAAGIAAIPGNTARMTLESIRSCSSKAASSWADDYLATLPKPETPER